MKPLPRSVIPLNILFFLLFIYSDHVNTQAAVRVEAGTTLNVNHAQFVLHDLGINNIGDIGMQHAVIKLTGAASRSFTGNAFSLDKMELAMSPGSQPGSIHGSFRWPVQIQCT